MADDHEKQLPLAAPSDRQQTRPWSSKTLSTLLTVLGVTSVLAMLGYVPMDTESINMRYRQWTGTCGPIEEGKCSPLRLNSPVPSTIDFYGLFPNLSSPLNSACRGTWGELDSVPCSDALVIRNEEHWPEQGYKGDDLIAIMMDTCNDRCYNALEDAQKLLNRRCVREDTFVSEDYSGSIHPSYLRGNAAQVMNHVRKDADRLCDAGIWNDLGADDWRFCKIFMWQKFRVDTSKDADLPAVRKMISHMDSADTRLECHSNGKLICGRCTLGFLNEALQSWEKGKVSTTDLRRHVQLPEFIRTVNEAGAMCSESNAWELKMQEAIEFYQHKGLLPSGWKLPDEEKTSSDLRVLMYGPSVDDYPLSEISKEMSHILGLRRNPEVEREDTVNQFRCILGLQEAYRLAGCHIHVDQDTLSAMMKHDMAERRSFYCNHGCAVRLNQFANTKCDVDKLTSNGRELVQGYWDARRQRDNYCALFGPEPADDSCARSIMAWGKESWAFTGRPETPQFLADVDDALDKLRQAAVLFDADAVFAQSEQQQKVLKSGREVGAARLPQTWYDDPSYSVCAECVWKWIAGHNLATTMDYMRTASSPSAYVDLAHKYWDTCTAVGADWLGEQPAGDDPVIWRVKSSQGRTIQYLRSLKDLNNGIGHFAVYDEEDPEGRNEMAFPMDEETGWVGGEPRPVNRQPGDAGTLWHILEAARGLEAERQGRFEEWRVEEAEKRWNHDLKTWRMNWAASQHGRETYGRPEDREWGIRT